MGAFDYISKPPDLNRLLNAVRNALDRKVLVVENKRLKKKVNKKYEMIGNSPAISQIKEIIDKVAPTDARVLITGGNGTGKELVAHHPRGRNFWRDGCALFGTVFDIVSTKNALRAAFSLRKKCVCDAVAARLALHGLTRQHPRRAETNVLLISNSVLLDVIRLQPPAQLYQPGAHTISRNRPMPDAPLPSVARLGLRRRRRHKKRPHQRAAFLL